jgi:Fur family zinc uptake transcriptional regulator
MSTCASHTHCTHTALADAEAICASHGLKFTAQRRKVFSIIWGSHKALTAAEIMAKLGNSQPPITYRALEFLEQSRLIHHVTSLNAYVGCTHLAQQHHVGQLLICQSCHTVQELEQEKTMGALEKAAKTKGFHVTHAHIELLGLCPACTAN